MLVKHLGFVFLCLIITANYWVFMIYCCVGVLASIVSVYTSLGAPFVLPTPFTFNRCLPTTMSDDLNPPSSAHGSPSRIDIPVPITPPHSPPQPNTETRSVPPQPGPPNHALFSTYADSVRFGMENRNAAPRNSAAEQNVAATETVPLDQPTSPHVLGGMDELIVLFLLAKIWGELLPLALIISKNKMDWKHIRDQIDYIELGNGWVLLRFASISDKNYVWFTFPSFVKGLNLVLTPWIPYFDPYFVAIGRIDQWVRIPRFPWEFWTLEALTNLLREVEEVVRVDHHTLLRQKGRFARVCINTDVTEALPGSLSIPTPNRDLTIPLIYEGLHEVCALCGSPTHAFDKCPCIPSIPKIEIKVEKFQA